MMRGANGGRKGSAELYIFACARFACVGADLAPALYSSLKFVLTQPEDQNMQRSRFQKNRSLGY